MQHCQRIQTKRFRRLMGIDAETLGYLSQNSHLIPDAVDAIIVAERFGELVTDQEQRIQENRPTSPVPLIWVALAEAAGLRIDIETGKIIDGPKGSTVPIVFADSTQVRVVSR